MHGWAIAKRIQQLSGEVLQVQQGSLYPALHRLEQQGWIKAKWAESETGRQAKFYSLTAAGRSQLGKGNRQLEPALSGHQPDRERGLSKNFLISRRKECAGLKNFGCELKCCFNADNAAARLDEELRFHLEHQIDENLAAGMSAAEARYAALQTFGNPSLLRDQSRATWSWNWFESLLRDVHLSVCTLRPHAGLRGHRDPGDGARHRG